MSGKTDLILAFLAATAIHAGALGIGVKPSGGGGGDTGQDRISLVAASPAIGAKVREWEQPPDISAPVDMAPPREMLAAPDAPESDVRPVRLPRIAALPQEALPNEAASVVTRAPELSQMPEPVVQASVSGTTDMTPLRPTLPDLRAPSLLLPKVIADTAPPTPDVAPHIAMRPPERQQQTSAPAVTRQVAAGLGRTGTRGQTEKAAPSNGAQQAATAAWAAEIQSKIARYHRYPRDAREEGRVRVAMVILPGGQLDRVSVAKSSGVAALDQAALAAVKRAAPFPPAPTGLNDKWFNVGQWITFKRR